MEIRWRERRWLWAVVKVVCGIATVPAVLLGFLIARSYLGGTTEVFLAVPFAKVTVDGRRVPGWVHRGIHGTWAYVTLNAHRRRESYGANLRPAKMANYPVHGCGPWTAPRFPFFATGQYGPPCMGGAQSFSKLVAKPGIIEFDADDGRRVSARW